ncbi:winged helix-turn-helix domain-containing protein [Macrococcus brunensis]|uniref:winged helix-turn-helix domain-containing protein n=1 Tax=Macrococcus brunensis TaxID=198483 RepID=UPI001EEFF2D7|nr:helix-turn-helix domain-containing protein [Macrococcus brunensis]ULG72203.1 helix-turn-helix domain-containing protein [Macrococcus brunensis]
MSNEVLKVLIDDKAAKIVELTKSESRTTKELAQLMNVKTSNLYYPIKKLLEVNAIKVVEERQIKNMTEYYYSSSHLDKEELNFDFPFITEHFDQIVAINMLEVQKVFSQMGNDIENNIGKSSSEMDKIDEPNTAMFSTMSVNLPYKEWQSMMKEMRQVAKKYHEKYKNDTLPEYRIQLSGYKYIEEKED